jgi:hypothetical protein
MTIRTKLTAALSVAALILLAACSKSGPVEMKEVTAQDAGDYRISVLSPTGELTQGQNDFRIAFTQEGKAADPGKVAVTSSMTMPGMAPMVAPIELSKAEPGQFISHGTFGMSGSWKFEVQWDGPTGKGGASFNASVR